MEGLWFRAMTTVAEAMTTTRPLCETRVPAKLANYTARPSKFCSSPLILECFHILLSRICIFHEKSRESDMRQTRQPALKRNWRAGGHYEQEGSERERAARPIAFATQKVGPSFFLLCRGERLFRESRRKRMEGRTDGRHCWMEGGTKGGEEGHDLNLDSARNIQHNSQSDTLLSRRPPRRPNQRLAPTLAKERARKNKRAGRPFIHAHGRASPPQLPPLPS